MKLSFLKLRPFFYFIIPISFLLTCHFLILSLIGPIRFNNNIDFTFMSERFIREAKLAVAISEKIENKKIVFGSSRTEVGFANLSNVINLGLPGGSIEEAIALISFVPQNNQKILLIEIKRLLESYKKPEGLNKRYVCALSKTYCRNTVYLYYLNLPLSFDLLKNFILSKSNLKILQYTKNGSKNNEFMKLWQSKNNIEEIYSKSNFKILKNRFNLKLINSITNSCSNDNNLVILPHPIYFSLSSKISNIKIEFDNRSFFIKNWLEALPFEFCGLKQINKTYLVRNKFPLIYFNKNESYDISHFKQTIGQKILKTLN